MSGKTINLTLKVWRQRGPGNQGGLETYRAENIPTAASFLEMLDIVNERLTLEGRDPIAFDHDCREGICGTCGTMVNGRPHGPEKETTVCQLHMRHFQDGDTLVIEPYRARALPLIKDLVVDRGALDRIIAAGGFISVNTGQAPEASSLPVPKENADLAMDAAACIGCGACVAACPNASAMLFCSAKIFNSPCCPRGDPRPRGGPCPWWPRWTPSASATVPTIRNARRNAPKPSPLPTSPASTGNSSRPPWPPGKNPCRFPGLRTEMVGWDCH